jgi:hypothetical protein
MQRPSDTLLIDFKVLEKFVENNITAVFNLCEPGEHPFCGSGNIPSTGFPYSPELLMKAGSKLSCFPIKYSVITFDCFKYYSKAFQFFLA